MSELSRLTGVGPKRLKALEAAGIRTLRDLVYNVPRRYIDRTRITPIAELREGDEAYVAARIDAVKTPPGRLIVTISDDTGRIELTFFNSAAFLRQQLLPGRRLSAAGTVKRFRTLQIAHPEWELLAEDQEPRGGLLPVYPLTESLAETRAEHKLLQKFALEALERFDFSDPLTPAERALLGLRPEVEALRALHAPESAAAVEAAREELKVRELWPLCRGRVLRRRERRNRGRPFPDTPAGARAEAAVRAALPFKPTPGQESVLAAIAAGLRDGGQFHGLLHGDVGSGKTAVALLSAVRVLAAGAQAALLAPTEILAAQHYRTLAPLLAEAGLRAALLTGETPAAERRRLEAELASGELAFVTGTHALLSGGVNFADLRYVLVDEQHRFGVEQRARLAAKGREPHVLYLSATPIPRTLAQSLYGDLDLLTLGEKPPGRLPVKTRIVPAAKQAELLTFLRAETATGNQVYWVVPRIGISTPSLAGSVLPPGGREGILGVSTTPSLAGSILPPGGREGIRGISTTPSPADSPVEEVAAIDAAVARLRAAGDWVVEAVHGRVPAAERARILDAFRRGDVHALVATTVIEVGVDVPGANLMVVEGADRFGLAQLHQLRGRTGRGQAQAWCFLLEPPAAPWGGGGWPEETAARLRTFAATEDGFALAEMDLRRRGAGQIDAFDAAAPEAGARQSGFGLLRFADVLDDADLIRALGEKAEAFLDAGA